ELPVGGSPDRAFERPEQRRIGLGIPKRLPLRVERGDASFGQEEAHRPIHLPMRSFSSGVVRINVTCGLWRWNLRLAKRSGMVSGAPKLTMSSAPAEPT